MSHLSSSTLLRLKCLVPVLLVHSLRSSVSPPFRVRTYLSGTDGGTRKKRQMEEVHKRQAGTKGLTSSSKLSCVPSLQSLPSDSIYSYLSSYHHPHKDGSIPFLSPAKDIAEAGE